MAWRKIKTKSNVRTKNDIVRRETVDYPSVEVTSCHTYKSESKQYSGNVVKGIATMHKSNAIPVSNGEQMKDVSKMRRN